MVKIHSPDPGNQRLKLENQPRRTKHEQHRVVKAHKLPLGLSPRSFQALEGDEGNIQKAETDDIKTRHVKSSVSRMSTSIENGIKQAYK